jgi:hypothetical protein
MDSTSQKNAYDEYTAPEREHTRRQAYALRAARRKRAVGWCEAAKKNEGLRLDEARGYCAQALNRRLLGSHRQTFGAGATQYGYLFCEEYNGSTVRMQPFTYETLLTFFKTN